MNLAYLLSPFNFGYIPNIYISGLSLNSKKIKSNYIFFSILGYNDDGRKYIIEAIKNGSKCVLIETLYKNNHGNIIFLNKNIPIIFFYKLKKYISFISGRYYNNPSKNLNFIGITGTNGKTTVTYLISSWINILKDKSYIISTIGNGVIGSLKKTINTTDSAIDIQKEIYKSKKKNIKNIISEISSHAISQYRINFIFFKLALLTNITHDHLDFHKNFNNYKKSKISFLKKKKINKSIINTDNKICKKHFLEFRNPQSICTNKKNIFYENKYIYSNKIIFKKNKTYIYFIYNNKQFTIKVNFLCKFNVTNLLLSILSMINLGYPIKDLIKTSKYLKLPPGRMEMYEINKKTVLIDYAHNIDSIKNILYSIKNIYNKKNIWCVFGCGGNKDVYKRKIMGKISEIYSHKIILTNDNPRTENENNIINDILKGINNKKKVKIILNRKEAIYYAIKKSDYNSIIAILGKGHEDCQILNNNKKIFLSDKDIINKFIKNDKF